MPVTVRAYIQNRFGTEWVDAGRDEALGRKLEIWYFPAPANYAPPRQLKRLINFWPYFDCPQKPPIHTYIDHLHIDVDHKSGI
jgi:hypothetical protein